MLSIVAVRSAPPHPALGEATPQVDSSPPAQHMETNRMHSVSGRRTVQGLTANTAVKEPATNLCSQFWNLAERQGFAQLQLQLKTNPLSPLSLFWRDCFHNKNIFK